jgi:glycosyltransferase 2 family protein
MTSTSTIRKLRNCVTWNRVGVVISLTIAGIALTALVRTLRTVEIDRVIEAVRLTEPLHIALAAALVATSYLSLTLYDLLALRAIGRSDIPYRIASLASFTSYPIAHGVGAVLPVSAAIRYRIYSAHGLSATDVAKICFLTGLTFWLGNLTALSLSILYDPQAIGLIDQLPDQANRLIAIAVLVGMLGYVGWTWTATRYVGRREWSLKLPSGPIMLLQVAIGIVDLGAAAMAMYMLMPADIGISAATMVVVFIAATLLGFASHAPAGIGVFDATILIGLGGEHKEQLLAVLLLFRLLYHLTPFVLALCVFILSEWWNTPPQRKPA